MNAKTHANILKGMLVVAIIGILLIVFQLGIITTETQIQFFCDSLEFFFALWLLSLFILPVRCNHLECNGRMRPRLIKESKYERRLLYKCDNCADVYDTNITIGLGEPGQW
jgi:hypothetical protein